MALNGAPKDEILRRREVVARLRLRGQSIREIALSLLRLPADMGGPVYGRDGKSAVAIATIHGDLKRLEADWRARAAEAIDERKARQLAEVDEAKRKAWADGDLQSLARFMKLEADIFGTNAPQKLEHTGPDGGPITVKAFEYGVAIASITAGSVGDSAAPGAAEVLFDGAAVWEDADGRLP